MNRNRILLAIICIPLLVLLSARVSGAEVFKWVGPAGITHYAEAPPEADLASLEILDVVIAEPAQSVVADYQSVLAVASSIESSRLERERVRLEREKLSLQERQLQQSQLLAEEQYYGSYSGGYYLPYRRYRHPVKPHPHKYGRNPVPTPYSNGGRSSSRGSTPGRVYLNR